LVSILPSYHRAKRGTKQQNPGTWFGCESRNFGPPSCRASQPCAGNYSRLNYDQDRECSLSPGDFQSMHPYIGHQEWITSYGLVLVLALVACWWLTRRNAATAGEFSPDGNYLLTATSTGAFIYDTQTWKKTNITGVGSR
jgi:hypothetical protein